MRNRGGQLKLLALSPKVAAILQVTQIIGVLDIYQKEDAAIRSFADG